VAKSSSCMSGFGNAIRSVAPTPTLSETCVHRIPSDRVYDGSMASAVSSTLNGALDQSLYASQSSSSAPSSYQRKENGNNTTAPPASFNYQPRNYMNAEQDMMKRQLEELQRTITFVYWYKVCCCSVILLRSQCGLIIIFLASPMQSPYDYHMLSPHSLSSNCLPPPPHSSMISIWGSPDCISIPGMRHPVNGNNTQWRV